ncbi:MAG: hypothetical protein ABI988_17585, partial [Nitrospirota bacterium]
MNRKDPMHKATKSKRMRRLEDPMSSVSSAQSAVPPDARTARRKTPERPLPEYVAAVSERTGIRVGRPLPLGTYAR